MLSWSLMPVTHGLAVCFFALLALCAAGRSPAQDGAQREAQVAAHLDAAKAAEADSDYATAAREYRAIVALRPEWVLIRQSLGVSLHLAGRYEEAIEHLSAAVRLDDQLWGAFLILGMDYYRTHRFERAIEALQRSSELNPDLLETQRWLGLSYAAAGSYDRAIRHLKRVAEADDRDAEALFSLARAYDSRASQLFEAIGAAEPESPFVSLLQAERFASEGEAERARAEFRRALDLRPDLAGVLSLDERNRHRGPAGIPAGDGLFAVIRMSFAAGRYQLVAEEAEAVLAGEAENAEAMYWLGRASKGLAARMLDRLTEVAPDSHRVDQLEAEFHMDRTEFSKAIDAYRRALRKKPQLAGLRYALGHAHRRMGSFDEAANWFEDELRRNPHHALARYSLGSLLLDRGRPAEALPHLVRASEATPVAPDVRFDLGRAYLETQDFAAAAREFERYARSEQGNDRVHFLLANAYRGLGRMDDARRELEIYQDLSRQRLRRVQDDVRKVSDDVNRLSR